MCMISPFWCESIIINLSLVNNYVHMKSWHIAEKYIKKNANWWNMDGFVTNTKKCMKINQNCGKHEIISKYGKYEGIS